LFGRYIRTTLTQEPPYDIIKSILATTVGGRDNLAQTFTLGDTYLIGASMVNSFRAAVNRTSIHRTNAPFLSPNDVGINVFDYVPEDLIVTITGGFNIGSGIEIESRYHTTTYELGDDVTWVKGSHQLAFGGYGPFYFSNSYANVRSSPNFSFTGVATGLGLGDFMTAKLTLLDQATPNTVFVRQWFMGLYAQDTWKLSRRLTVNYGLRWEPWFPTIAANGAIYNFSLDRLAITSLALGMAMGLDHISLVALYRGAYQLPKPSRGTQLRHYAVRNRIGDDQWTECCRRTCRRPLRSAAPAGGPDHRRNPG
jgi:hypothetical protein